MKYLLDTNTGIRFINGHAPKIREHFLAVSESDIVVSAITKAKMFYGATKSQTPDISRTKQVTFFSRFISFPFDDAAALIYGAIRAALEKSGTPIGANDLLIASIAISQNLILITHNTAEFQRITDLRLEDWEV